jgi:predicted DNA-binding protein
MKKEKPKFKLFGKTKKGSKRTLNDKLNEICRETDRSKSNLIRWVVQKWIEKM